MTEQFTPTTEQVENAYSYDPEYEYHNPVDTGYVARNRSAFKRWLAEHDREVAEKAFDEGKEAFARSFLTPLRENGTRPPVLNPYRKETP